MVNYAGAILFQYISCCYLSKDELDKIAEKGRFNTSHVAIYRSPFSGSISGLECFNTSHVAIYRSLQIDTHNPPFAFQYISCCYLSESLEVDCTLESGFNTSHVAIYRYDPARFLYAVRRFNTSHVAIYRQRLHPPKSRSERFNTSHVAIYHLAALTL